MGPAARSERRAQGAGHRAFRPAQGAEHRAQGAGRRAQKNSCVGWGCRCKGGNGGGIVYIYSAERRAQGAGRRAKGNKWVM
jgi:hypothetical protein